MHNRSLAIALAMTAAALSFGTTAGRPGYDSKGEARIMGLPGEPESTPNTNRRTGAAAQQRAARKRRNVRARSSKRRSA